MANIVPLDALKSGHGFGYEEMQFQGDGEDPAGVCLVECVWIYGHILTEDGCTADVDDPVYASGYGRKGGERIWNGLPTEEQRRETLWAE